MTTFNAGAIEANLTLGRSSWTKDLRLTKKEIADLEKTSITIGIDADTDNAMVAINNLELMAEDLDNTTYTPSVDLITREAEAALAAIEARLDALDSRNVVIAVDADTDNALIALDNLERDMDTLEADPVGIEVDVDAADAEARLLGLMQATQTLSLTEVDIDVDVDGYSAAVAQLGTLEAQVNALDGRDVDIDVNVDRAMLQSLVGDPGGGGRGGYIGLLRILIYALIVLSPVLAVATGALTAAIVGFSAALVGALGPLAVLAGGLAGLVGRYNEAVEAAEGADLTGPVGMLQDALERLDRVWDRVLDRIEPEGFELMANALNLVSDILPTLVPLFEATAEAMGGVIDGIRGFVESSEYDEMINFFTGFGIDMLVQFMDILGNLIVFFGRLFDAIEPFARAMMQGLEDLTASWAAWADELDQNQAFQDFMDNALTYGPQVLDMLGSLLDAFMNIGEALRPFAGPMLEGLTGFFDFIANMDPDTLTIIIGALAGLWLGMSVIAPLIGAIVGGFSALLGILGAIGAPLLIAAGLIAAFGYAIWELWQNNEEFRQSVIDTWNAIVETVGPIIEDIVNYIRDNWGTIVDWATTLWNDFKSIIVDAMAIIKVVVVETMNDIRDIWARYGDQIIRIVMGFVQAIGAVIGGAMQMIKGIFRLIRGIVTGDWRMMWSGIVSIARGFWQILSGLFRGMVNVLGGIFTIIGRVLERAWRATMNWIEQRAGSAKNWIVEKFNSLVGFFQSMPSKISGAASGMWNGIRSSFQDVINDIIRWWNNLSFSINIPDKIPGLPPSFTISTPNIPYLARGAYVTDPTLAVVGEGPDNELVTPEPMLREIVRENSGGAFDYEKMASVLAEVLARLLARDDLRGVTRDDLFEAIAAAGMNFNIEAGLDERQIVRRMVSGIGFELRRLGFGGKHRD